SALAAGPGADVPADRGAAPAIPGTGPRDLPVNEKSDAKLQRLMGSDGKIKHTAHYAIGYDTSDEAISGFVTRVEATYGAVVRFAEKMGVETRAPAQKLNIVFFKRFEGYEKYLGRYGIKASEDVPGMYLPEPNRSSFFDFSDAKALREMKQQLDE